MEGVWLDLALIVALVALNALFAGSEIALVTLRDSQLRRLQSRGTAHADRLARLVGDPNRYLSTIQIGITLAGFLASATAAVSLAQPLVPLLSFAGEAAEPLAVALVTAALAFVSLVVGELAPKRLAMQYAQSWALHAAAPLDWLATLTRPVVWALGRATDALVRLLGGDPTAAGEPPTAGELREMLLAHRGLTGEQRAMVVGALEIHERALRTALTPRTAVLSLPADVSAGQARLALAASGHSRAPVVAAGHLDDVHGVVHLRDLVAANEDTAVSALAHPVVRFPDVMRVSEALRRFMAAREQFALVIDEYGSTAGIVTIEDLLEQIVGQIYDEAEAPLTPRREEDGSVLLPGGYPVRELLGLGVDPGELPPGPFTTVAGLVLSRLGHIPAAPGESVTVGHHRFEVVQVEHHAITAVRLRADAGGAST